MKISSRNNWSKVEITLSKLEYGQKDIQWMGEHIVDDLKKYIAPQISLESEIDPHRHEMHMTIRYGEPMNKQDGVTKSEG